MSIMSGIRNNMVLVVVLIAVAILAFTVQDTLSNLVGGGGSVNEVGEVAGQSISVQEFNERYQLLLSNQRAPGAPPLDDRQINQTLDNAWTQMVNEIIINNEKEEIGLQVTGAELADMFTGRNISQYVESYFGSFFNSPQAVEAGYTQGFTGENVRKYIQTLQDQGTPEQKLAFKEFESNLKDFREQSRFNNLLLGAYPSSTTMARKLYMEKNRSYDISYVAVPYASISDSVVEPQVTDADYRRLIEENKFQHEQKAATVIQYVVFDIKPTAADSSAARQELLRDKDRFQLAKNDSTFTLGKTRDPYKNELSDISNVSADVQDAVLNAAPGTVWGPYLDLSFNGSTTEAYYRLYKLVKSEESSEDVWAKIRYKTVPFTTDTTASESEARGFVSTARSQGMDSLDNVLDGGWYTKGNFGPDVDEAVKTASIGSIIGPIKGRGGWMIVEVLNKTNKQFGVANIENVITYSDGTKRSVDKEASLFAAKAMDMANIESAASEENIISYPSQELTVETPASFTLTGLQEGSRQVVRWALTAKDNEFSEIIEAGNSFIFAQVIDKRSPGTKSVAQLRGQLRTQVLNRKRAEIIKDRLNKIGVGNDLAAIVSAYNQQYGEGAAIQSTATDILFNSNQISGIGNAPKVVGTVAGMQLNAVKGPIADALGVYVVQLTNINEADEPDAITLQQERQNDANAVQAQFSTKVNAALRELAKVKDTRYKAGF